MTRLEQIQEQLLDREVLLAELELENTSPVIIGGYNARPYSVTLKLMEEPRPTEIKGLWRWWARALVSGVLFQQNIDVTIAEANKIISHVLGGSVEGKLEPSKLSINIKVLEANITSLDQYVNRIARLRLLSQGIRRNTAEYIERSKAYSHLRLKLKVFKYHGKSLPVSFYEFALLSLILSLMFSGLGALTTRAFGSIKIKINKLNQGLSHNQDLQDLRKMLERLYYENISINEAKRIIQYIIHLALSSSEKYINSLRQLGVLDIKFNMAHGIPSIPSIVINNVNIFRWELIQCKHTNIYDILFLISSSTLKQQMKNPCFGVNPKGSGVNIHTFIIGLPRNSEINYGTYKLRTGYVVPKTLFQGQRVFDRNNVKQAINTINEELTKKLRRISTIGFTTLKDNPSIILVYGMLAKDINMIKHEIMHRGIHGKAGKRGYISMIVDTRLDRVNVINEFNKLWECIVTILLRQRC